MTYYLQCPAGFVCTTTGTMTQCTAGTYAAAGAASCTTCTAGQACPTTNSLDIYSCPTGTYSLAGATYCTMCPAGYSCTSTAITACASGSFAQPGAAACTQCPSGFYCPYTNAPHVLPCPPGTSSAAGATACTVCPAGSACATRMTSTIATCTSTKNYAIGGAYVCAPCPGGMSCTGGIGAPCSAGYYSAAGDSNCLICPTGSYCPTGTSYPILCPPGTYTGSTGAVICTVCAEGTYAIEGATACTACTAGYYCPMVYTTPRKCSPGTYSDGSTTSCTPCTIGYYCDAGSTSSTKVVCPAGYYCNYITNMGFGGIGKFPCPAGSYRSTTGATAVGDCADCTASNYCPDGCSTPVACPKGHYCPVGTMFLNQFPCAPGTYNPSLSKTASTDCISCTAGYYCPPGSPVQIQCPPGYYCPAGTGYLTNGNLIPAGYYSGLTAQSSGSGNGCPAGYYCPVGCVFQIPCPPGTYRSTTGAQSRADCSKCSAGYYCEKYASTSATTSVCPLGYYCPEGTEYPREYPCPPGTYGAATQLTAESQCTSCPAGKACDGGTNANTNPMKRCQPGYYCPLGSASPKQTPCPAGTYSTTYEGSTSAACNIQCDAGSYCLAGSDRVTGECQEGYYCPAGSTKLNNTPCPAGTYSNLRKLYDSSQCTTCPMGYYCPAGVTAPIMCPGGTYNTATGKGLVSDCATCTAGYYCPRASAAQIACGLGMYSMAGSKVCLDCLAGHYCDTTTTSDSTMVSNVCQTGYYCPKGTGLFVATTLVCPAGYFCAAGVDHPTKCSPGQISASQAGACTSAVAGTYTTLGSGTATGDCKAGHYCPTGSWSSISVPCPAGTYRATTGAIAPADCLSCTAGYYCQEATAIPVLCPQGYYCPLGSKLPTKCAIGFYGASFGLIASGDCTSCPAGTYCSLPGLPAPEGLCDAGYYCVLAAATSTPTDGTTGNICPAGGYCETGSRVSQSCPPGRYNPNTGGRDLEACIQCPPGYYCSGEAKATTTGPCAAGYYCPTGSYMNNMKPAEPGYYTLDTQSTETPCAEGYYNPYYAQSACIKCPAGFLCKGTANAGTFVNCPTGNYCPEGSVLATTCLKGTYNPNYNGKSVSDCWPCPPGKYCSIVGLDTPGDGTTTSDSDCDAGYYCKTSSNTKAPDSDDPSGNFGPCPTGYYCPKGISNPIPCPPGTYSATTKISAASSCLSCTAGKYCSKGGLSAPEGDCGAGYYCPAGSKVPKPAATQCPIGYSCPTGSSVQVPCSAGTYQDEVGQASCKTCPAGYYCPVGSSSLTGHECPVGYYCPSGTQQMNQNACPIGTYNPYTNANSVNQCILCDPGRYCLGTGLSTTTGQCKAGYYCRLGSPTDSPPSTATGAPSNHGNVCPLGSYCPLGSAMSILCPGGKYCSTTTLALYEGDCSAGYYCRLGASSKTPTDLSSQGGAKCPAGHYCPVGSDSPTPCPPGTFSANVGNTQLSDCTFCTNGKYCKDAGATVETGSCDPGYFCLVDTGTMTTGYTVSNPASQLCPIGYYCPAGAINKLACTTGYQDLQGQSSCNSCPAGYYCSTTAKSLCRPSLENLSYYCPADVMTKINCPSGTYNMIDGTTSSSDCTKCPPGYYCPVDSTLAKIIPCAAGYYCKNTGSSTSSGDGACPIGYYCPAGTQNPIACPAGKFCSTGGLTDSILTDAAYNCQAGFICYGKSSSATPSDATTGDYCPAGFYCPAGTKAPIACPIGYYRSAMKGTAQTDCTVCTAGKSCNSRGLTTPTITCPAGYYCVAGTSTEFKTPCPIGAYCPSGSSTYTVCADKTYQNNPASTQCIDCPERFYCKNSGSLTAASKPVECPAGSYCGDRTATPTACPIATFSNRPGLSTSSECDSCTPGYYCATTGLTTPTDKCTAGYYCSGGSKTATPNDATGSICPKGNYCPAGSTAPTPCPPGTYNDYTGRTISTDCSSCIAGYFCPLRGATSMDLKFGSSEFKCTAGYYCNTGSTIPNPTDNVKGNICAAGTYCPAGSSAQTQCDKGYYNPDPGQSACLTCPAGKYCPSSGMTTPTDCEAGFYCIAGSYKHTACPAGTYSPFTNLESSDQCIDCDPGYYCAGGSSTTTGQCDAGYVCPRKASVASSSSIYSLASNSAGLCPMGYYCPSKGASAPTPCPIGTYNDDVGTIVCKACPAGKYCDELAQTSATKSCAAGHLCISGATQARPTDGTTGRLCTAGFYCPSGTASEKPCAAGYYEPRQGSSSCQVCPAGYYCAGDSTGTTTPTNCPYMYYCPEGSSAATYCPDGTFGRSMSDKLESDSQCMPCPSGSYCQKGAVAGVCKAGYYCDVGASKPQDVTKLCPAGHYCLVGCKLPTRCPKGKFNLDVGATNDTYCQDCTTGYYCIAGSSVPIKCPVGHYCIPPSDEPIACPIGTYQPDTLQISSAVCTYCPAGTYCYEQAIYDPTMYPCPVGKYCLEANDTMANINDAANYKIFDCPFGTYRNTTGAESDADCSDCPGGYYCNNGTIHPKPCHGGYYCTGKSNETACPAGYYCPPITEKPVKCPGAYYCPSGAEIYIKCDNGYYCPEGSVSPTPCPAGYTGSYNLNNVNVSMGCTECTPGYYSVSTSTALECLPCTAGYVCLGGTNVATPTNSATDGGEECPVGYYCPTGTYKPLSCPKGTYNAQKVRTALTDCLSCPSGTFNPYYAASSCMSCGNSSVATSDGLTCECKGKYRAYQVKSAKCLCQPQYEPADGIGNDDSTTDCQPIIFDRCTSTQIRDPDGKCVEKDYCPTCPNGQGTRSPGIGVCECVKVAVLNDVCNDTCRSKSVTLAISYTGAITITDPTSSTNTSISLSSLSTFYGNMSCPTTSCKIASMSVSQSSGFSANYQPTTSVVNAYKKSKTSSRLLEEGRLLTSASDTGITSPIVCLSMGDTMMFEIASSADYPVYDKDNLLNSNANFDYSAFELLAEKLKAGTNITDFGFTFTQAGRYVFKNNNNQEQLTIIGVMDTNEKCSDSSRYIQSISTSSLLKLGMTQNEDIILSPDWGLIFGLIAAILFGTPLLIGFIKYFTQSSWLRGKATVINYRQVNQKADYDEFTSKGKEWKRDLFKGPEGDHLQAPQGNAPLNVLVDEDNPLIARPNDREKQIIEMRKKENIEGVHEIPTDIFRDLYKELQYHAKFVKDEFARKAGLDSDNIKKVFSEIDRLKLLMQEKLQNIAKSYGRGIRLMFTEGAEGDGELFVERDKNDEEEEKKEENKSVASESDEEKQTEKVEFKAEMLDELDQRDQQKVDEMAETLREQHAEIEQQLNDDEKERRAKFTEEISSNSKLSPEEKKALLADFDKSNAKLQKLLMVEEQAGEDKLQQMLEQRRRRRVQVQEEVTKLEQQKKEVEAGFEKKQEDIDAQKQAINSAIDQEIEKEKIEEVTKLEQKKNEELQNVRQKFQKKLKKDMSEGKRSKMLEKFSQKMKALEDELEDARKKDQEEMLMKLDMKRQNRRAEREMELKKKERELKEEQAKETKAINAKLTMLNENLQNEQMDEMLKKAADEVEKDKEGEPYKEPEATGELVKENRAKESALQQEAETKLDEQTKELVKEEQSDIKTLEQERTEVAKKVQAMIAQVKDKKSELTAQVAKAGTPAEKKKLLEDYQQYKADVEQQVQTEMTKQNSAFDEKIAERKRRRVAKEAEARAGQEKELDELRRGNRREEAAVRRRQDEQKLQRQIEKMKMMLTQDELPFAVERLVDDKHMAEFSEMLKRQLKDKADTLKNGMEKLLKLKAEALQRAKEGVDAQAVQAKKLYDKGVTKKEDYMAKMEELKEQKEKALKEVEFEYAQKQNELEEQKLMAIEKSNSEELVELLKSQATEKQMYMQAFVSDEFLKKVLAGDKATTDKEVATYEKDVMDSYKKRNQEIEAKRKKIEDILMGDNAKIKDLEAQAQKMLEDQQLRDKKREEKQKKALQEKLASKEEELSKQKGITEEEKRKLLDEHQKELAVLTDSMEKERARQRENIKGRIQEKLKQKELLKKQRDEQITIIQKEEEKLLDAKVKEIQKEKGIETEEEKGNLAQLNKKYEHAKFVYEKMKPLAGIELEPEKEQENVLKGILESKKKTAKEPSKIDLSFELLFDRLRKLESSVGTITGLQFEQIFAGFLDLNNKLENITSGNVQKLPPGKLEEAMPDSAVAAEEPEQKAEVAPEAKQAEPAIEPIKAEAKQPEDQ